MSASRYDLSVVSAKSTFEVIGLAEAGFGNLPSRELKGTLLIALGNLPSRSINRNVAYCGHYTELLFIKQ